MACGPGQLACAAGTAVGNESTELYDLDGDIFNANATQPNHTAFDGLEFFHFYQTEQLTFLWIIFTMIVVGNSSVLVALLLSKGRKSRMNFFIMQLAIADLTVGLVNVLTDIIWKITIDFYGGNILCKLVRYLQVLVTYSSTYVLVALSIDRYDAIRHPMNFSGKWKRSRLLVASAWGLSAAFSIPAVFLNEENVIRGSIQCWIALETHEWQVYITLVALSLFFLPALIISACYSVIVYTIWTKSKIMAYPKLSKSSTISKSSTAKKKSTESVPDHNKRASSRGIIPKAKIKTVKMTFVIVFVFVLCWSPYFIYDLLQVYGYISESQASIAVSTFIQSLAPLNSAANPIIYCLFSTHICRNLSDVCHSRKIPFCDWLAETIFCCWPSMKRTTNQNSRQTDYSTMTDTMSRSSGRSSSTSQRIHMKHRSPRDAMLVKHVVGETSPSDLKRNSHV